jgi:multimeric flavodoxin WrbA
MKYRVIGISGSPKKNGLTDLLLDASLAGARSAGASAEKLILNDLRFRPCQSCSGCLSGGGCVQSDDMTRVYRKLSAADALIIASPIYFGTVTAQLKAMIDRCNCVWAAAQCGRSARTPYRRKKGSFICVAADNRKEYFDNARMIIRILFTTIGAKYTNGLFACGSDGIISDPRKKKELFRKAYDIGLSVVRSKNDQFPR